MFSYQYVPIDLEKNDGFFEYKENLTNIKFEIFETKLNNENYIIYQYENKKDVKYNEVKKEYINYISVDSIGNMEVFRKNTNIFVITKKSKIKKNLYYKESITKYISFMPNETKDKFNITNIIKEYDIIEGFNNIYIEIKIDPIYNYLSIYSGGKDLLFSIEGTQNCNERKCDFDISQCKNKMSKCELKIINFDYKKKVKKKNIYYLLYLKPNDTIEYSDNDFVKFFYYENINYTYQLNNKDYIDKYFNLKEGAIVYYTHPDNLDSIEISSETISSNSTPQFWYSNSTEYYYIIYFLPNNINTLKFRLNYFKENIMGDISIIAVKPTDIINYPEKYIYNKKKEKFVPSILRIVFDNNLHDDLLLRFAPNTLCVDGNLFDNNIFNPPINCESKKINSTLKGKNLTVIFKNEIKVITSKDFNFTNLIEYELKHFSFNNTQKEIAFKFDFIHYEYKTFYLNFQNPNKNYKYFIFQSFLDIQYNPNTKKYLNPSFSGYLENTISFSLNNTKLAIIIQCNTDECIYDDYISIRCDNINVNLNHPYSFNKFQTLSYVVFKFEANENIKYRIETNTELGGYNQTLQNHLFINNDKKNNENFCKEKYCLFNFEGTGTKYLIVKTETIPNKKNLQISKLMYILFNKDQNEFEMTYYFGSSQYFISSFKFIYKLTNKDIVKKINENGETGFVLKIGRYIYDDYKINVKYLNEYSEPVRTIVPDYLFEFDYYYYYINTNNSLNEYFFEISGTFEFKEPSYITFAYISPITLINFPINNIINDTSSRGIPVYVRLIKNKFNFENQYIIGVSRTGRYTKGKIIKDDGKSLNIFNNAKRYEFSNNYTNDLYTFSFDNNPMIIFSEIKGEYKYYQSREYDNYVYNIKKDINTFYIGLYSSKQNLTCAFIDGNENNLVNIYDMTYGNDLKSLINEKKIESNFICLNEYYDIIKFNCSNDKNITFIIYNPQINEEEFTNSNNKFYIPKNKNKKIFFEEEEFSYDIFRIIIKIYSKNEIDLEYGKTEKKEYFKFLHNNSFSFVLQYNIDESELYNFKSNFDSMVFMTLLEGKIYEEITLQKNDSTITLNNNSIAFELLFGTDFALYKISISNFERSFYYKIYETNETDFGKLILPQLKEPNNYIDYNSTLNDKNNKSIDIFIDNPYYVGKTNNQKYIFVMSYVHDFEKEIVQKNNYNLKLIYIAYEKLKNNSFNIINQNHFNSNYSLEKGNSKNISITFSQFTDTSISGFQILLLSSKSKETILLNNTYIQFETNIYLDYVYILNVNSSDNFTGKYSCIEISYKYGNNNNNNFEKYNNMTLKVDMDSNGLISFDSINVSQPNYEIYITSAIDKYKNLFNNDCFLNEKKNQIKNNILKDNEITFIEVKETKYQLKDKKKNLLINVVGIDDNYNMRIVYKPLEYNEPTSIGWIIFWIALIIIIVLICIVLFFKCHQRKFSNDMNLINENEKLLPS